MAKNCWLTVMCLLFFTAPSFAWDGTDRDTGDAVEIGSGELVRSGSSIEFYDYSTGEYHQGDIADINRYGSTVEIELFDYATGESRTLEMDD